MTINSFWGILLLEGHDAVFFWYVTVLQIFHSYRLVRKWLRSTLRLQVPRHLMQMAEYAGEKRRGSLRRQDLHGVIAIRPLTCIYIHVFRAHHNSCTHACAQSTSCTHTCLWLRTWREGMTGFYLHRGYSYNILGFTRGWNGWLTTPWQLQNQVLLAENSNLNIYSRIETNLLLPFVVAMWQVTWPKVGVGMDVGIVISQQF